MRTSPTPGHCFLAAKHSTSPRSYGTAFYSRPRRGLSRVVSGTFLRSVGRVLLNPTRDSSRLIYCHHCSIRLPWRSVAVHWSGSCSQEFADYKFAVGQCHHCSKSPVVVCVRCCLKCSLLFGIFVVVWNVRCCRRLVFVLLVPFGSQSVLGDGKGEPNR